MSMELCIDLLRHGETHAGEAYTGQLDVALTTRGQQQMEQAVEHRRYRHIVSSPLGRCADFARQLGQQLACTVTMEARFKEIHFGTWQGRTSAALMREAPDELSRFWADPLNNTPPAGESLEAFERRIATARNALERQTDASPVLLVTHAGVIRVLLCQWLGLPLARLMSMHIPPASLSRVQLAFADGTVYPQVRFINRHGDE